MYYHTNLKIKDKTITPVKLANFLKQYINKDDSLQFHLSIAKELIAGKEFIYQWMLKIPKNDFIIVEKMEILSDYEIVQKAKEEENKYYNELRLRGANGDVEAAIEFCKSFDESRYTVSAFA